MTRRRLRRGGCGGTPESPSKSRSCSPPKLSPRKCAEEDQVESGFLSGNDGLWDLEDMRPLRASTPLGEEDRKPPILSLMGEEDCRGESAILSSGPPSATAASFFRQVAGNEEENGNVQSEGYGRAEAEGGGREEDTGSAQNREPFFFENLEPQTYEGANPFCSPPRVGNIRQEFVFLSPMFVRPLALDSDSSEDDEPRRYRLRPRNLFNGGVTIGEFNMKNPHFSDSEDEFFDDEDDEASPVKKKTKKKRKPYRKKRETDEDDLIYLLESSDSDDDFDLDDTREEKIERKRSSYSGIRGPKADAKALSLVTNCPVSVKWLVDNFEYSPGRSLPRGFVYDQYVLLCAQNQLEPVNAASFGKLIRSVFPGLKTRRLGTRGNSKYHYNGVYLKTTSPLMTILNLIKTQQGLSYDGNGKRGRKVRRCFSLEGDDDEELFRTARGDPDEFIDSSPVEYLAQSPAMSITSAPLEIPVIVPPGIDAACSFPTFRAMYTAHCKKIIQHFQRFELRQIFEEWKRFWRVKCATNDDEGIMKYKDMMSRATLFKICVMDPVLAFIKTMDLWTYQQMLNSLFPHLAKGLPITMVNCLRQFIKNFDSASFKILDAYPKSLVELKLRCLRAFVAVWNDHLRLNRLMKSAMSTLKLDDGLPAMQSELARSMDIEELDTRIKQYKRSCLAQVLDQLVHGFHHKLISTVGSPCPDKVKTWIGFGEEVSDLILHENAREVDQGEISSTVVTDPHRIWRRVSDQILGALVKGNAVSYGIFKIFLVWFDNVVQQVVKQKMAIREGYQDIIFYYEAHLPETSIFKDFVGPIYPKALVYKSDTKTEPVQKQNLSLNNPAPVVEPLQPHYQPIITTNAEGVTEVMFDFPNFFG